MTKRNPILQARADAKAEALEEFRQVALTYLEKKYMDNEVKRGSERGDAILELTRELSELLRA